MNSPSQPDDLLTALRAARPDPGYQPSPASPEAVALLSRITADHHDSERLRPRRLPRRLVLTGISAIAGAAAAGGIAVATTRSAGPSRPLSPTAGSLPEASSVRAAILDAFQQGSGDILAAVRSLQTNGTAGTLRIWSYPMFPQLDQQVRVRLFPFRDGRPIMDYESIYIQPEPNAGRPPAGMIFAVNYQNRTWFRGQTSMVPVVGNVGLSPSEIRDDVASGMFRVAGTAELDGRRALKLVFFPCRR